MKLLLTSAGITNESIAAALRELLGKPTANSSIVVVPTAQNAQSGDKSWVVEEDIAGPYRLGWKEFAITDLAAVDSLNKEIWWQQLEDADVLLFGGGNSFYLSYWLQRTGVDKAIPQWLKNKVYVGISAGSMVASGGLQIDEGAFESTGELRLNEYDTVGPTGQSATETLKLVEFAFRPHYNSPKFPSIRKHLLEKVAGSLDMPMYAVDDQTAIKVSDGKIEVVGEGSWQLF